MQTQLFPEEIFDQEPPLGSLVAEAERAGARIRRRRAVASTAGVAALVIGVIASIAVVAHGSGSCAPSSPAASRPVHVVAPLSTTLPLPGGGLALPLPTPVAPTAKPLHDPIAITRQSFAQLLIDLLPPAAAVDPTATVASLTDANVASATVLATLRGSGKAGSGGLTGLVSAGGSVDVSMTHAGGPPIACEKADSRTGTNLACQVFTLASGVTVVESVDAPVMPQADVATLGYRYIDTVTVRHADGVTVTIEAANYGFHQSRETPSTAAPALTLDQLATAALDSRWAWTADHAFVSSAARLHLNGAPVG